MRYGKYRHLDGTIFLNVATTHFVSNFWGAMPLLAKCESLLRFCFSILHLSKRTLLLLEYSIAKDEKEYTTSSLLTYSLVILGSSSAEKRGDRGRCTFISSYLAFPSGSKDDVTAGTLHGATSNQHTELRVRIW